MKLKGKRGGEKKIKKDMETVKMTQTPEVMAEIR